jgi:hypothetical protein
MERCNMSWGLLDDALGAFNLIDLVSGFLAGVSYGDVGGHRIAVSTTADSSHSLNEVRAILSKAGVATYRRGFDSEEIWVHVKNRQARWAEYALRRAGVSVNMATVDSRNVGWANQAKHEGKPVPSWMRQAKERKAAKRAANPSFWESLFS